MTGPLAEDSLHANAMMNRISTILTEAIMSSRGWFWVIAVTACLAWFACLGGCIIRAASASGSMVTEKEYDAALDAEYGKGFAKAMHHRVYEKIALEVSR